MDYKTNMVFMFTRIKGFFVGLRLRALEIKLQC